MTGNPLPRRTVRSVLDVVVSLLAQGDELRMIVTRTEECDAALRNTTHEGLLLLSVPDTQPVRFLGVTLDEDGVQMVSAEGLPCAEFQLDPDYGPSFAVATTDDDGTPITRLAGSLVLQYDAPAKRHSGSFYTGNAEYPEVILCGTFFTSTDGTSWIALTASLGNGQHLPLPKFQGRVLAVNDLVHVVTSSLERTPSPYNW